MSNAEIKIGTSGFCCKDWLGNFYPQFCPEADFLRFYCSRFKTVEVNSTFHKLPDESTVLKWSKCCRKNFIFSARFPKEVTHLGKIETRIATAQEFIKVMDLMGDNLGPLLMQFPTNFKPECKSMLKELIDSLPDNKKIVIEVRNRDWLLDDDFLGFLSSKNIALSLVDHPCMPRVDIKTADFSYIRLLAGKKDICSDYTYIRHDREDDLGWWNDLILSHHEENRNIFAYFDNQYSGHAPTTAYLFMEKLSQQLENSPNS